MKHYRAYLLGAISTIILALPTQASVTIAPSSQTVNPAVSCACTSPSDTALLDYADNRDCELAMDTEDAILTGVVGAAIIGAAVIASNNDRHRETIIVEQAPPPPPPPRTTVIVHETKPAPPAHHHAAYGAPPRHPQKPVVITPHHVPKGAHHQNVSRSQRHNNHGPNHQKGHKDRR